MSGGNCGTIRALKIFPIPTLLCVVVAAVGGEGGLAEMDTVEASTGHHHTRDRQAVTGLELWPPTSLTFQLPFPLHSPLGQFSFCLTYFPSSTSFTSQFASHHISQPVPTSSTSPLNPSLTSFLTFNQHLSLIPGQRRKEGRKESDA